MSKHESHQFGLGDLSLKDRNSTFCKREAGVEIHPSLTVREQTLGQNSSSDLTQEQERMNETKQDDLLGSADQTETEAFQEYTTTPHFPHHVCGLRWGK